MPELYILGTVQGLFFSLLLFTKKNKSGADIYLALFILLLAFSLLSAYLAEMGFYSKYTRFVFIDMGVPLLYGPLLWMYTDNFISNRSFKFSYLLHFLPFILVYIVFYKYFLMGPSEKIKILAESITKIPIKYQLVNIIALISIPVYFLLIMNTISINKHNIRENYTDIEKVNLKWLKLIVWGFICIWLIVCLSVLLVSFTRFSLPFGHRFYINAAFVVFIYFIGYYGVRQGYIYIDSIVPKNKKIGDIKSLTYMRTTLDQSEYDPDIEKLMELMKTEKPYIDQELTLAKLAGFLGIKPYILSDILNNRLKRSFFDFIHYYRVEEVKRRMAKPDSKQFTILAIAYDSGFSSKSSFNRIFKELTALTPSEYKESLERQKERKDIYDTGG